MSETAGGYWIVWAAQGMLGAMTTSLGLDFGTTNTVIARCQPTGEAAPLVFHHKNEAFSTFRSVLCFWKEHVGTKNAILSEAGPWAIEHFIEDPRDCRFLQSLKSFAASRLFESTIIYGKRYTFENLLQTFLQRVRAHAGGQSHVLPRRFVVGRPVKFGGSHPDAALALARYEAALQDFGSKKPASYMNPSRPPSSSCSA